MVFQIQFRMLIAVGLVIVSRFLDRALKNIAHAHLKEKYFLSLYWYSQYKFRVPGPLRSLFYMMSVSPALGILLLKTQDDGMEYPVITHLFYSSLAFKKNTNTVALIVMMKTALCLHCQKNHSLLLPLTHFCVFSSHNRSIVSVILGTIFLEFLMLNSVLLDTKFLAQIFFEYLVLFCFLPA